jgi:hypothetical protein
LDGSPTETLAAVALLHIDFRSPLLLRGVDGNLLQGVRVPSAFRTWSYVVSPGPHLLWVTNVPFGHPLLPQFIRCFAIEVSLDAGAQYSLRYNPSREEALVLREETKEPIASGRLVDKPLMLERSCRWN